MPGDLSRREVLRIGAIGTSISLAGCSRVLPFTEGPGESTRMRENTDEFSTMYTFIRDGDEQLKVDTSYRLQKSPYGYETPLHTQVWHKQGTHLNSLRYTFGPAPNTDYPPQFFLLAPNHNWPDTTFHETEDGRGMVFNVPDLGIYADSTVEASFFIRLNSDVNLPVQLQFIAELDLSEEGFMGGDYTLNLDEKLELPLHE